MTFWIVIGVVVTAVTIFAVLMSAGFGGSMTPTLQQRATWKADAYVSAVFHGTGAPMETVLAERDRYIAELLRQWGEPEAGL